MLSVNDYLIVRGLKHIKSFYYVWRIHNVPSECGYSIVRYELSNIASHRNYNQSHTEQFQFKAVHKYPLPENWFCEKYRDVY